MDINRFLFLYNNIDFVFLNLKVYIINSDLICRDFLNTFQKPIISTKVTVFLNTLFYHYLYLFIASSLTYFLSVIYTSYVNSIYMLLKFVFLSVL